MHTHRTSLGRWGGVLAAALTLTGCLHFTEYPGDTITLGFKPPPPPPPPPRPPQPPPARRVEVQGDRVVIHEKIQFDEARSTIRAESSGLLDEIAAVLKDPANLIKKIRVEGHASSDGDPDFNTQLSTDRAAAVVAALESRGVPAAMMISQGFGSSEPIADNATEEGREENRRVDFVILETLPAGANPAAKTKPKGGH